MGYLRRKLISQLKGIEEGYLTADVVKYLKEAVKQALVNAGIDPRLIISERYEYDSETGIHTITVKFIGYKKR